MYSYQFEISDIDHLVILLSCLFIYFLFYNFSFTFYICIID